MEHSEIIYQKALAFDKTIAHLRRATKDGRRREQLRARIGLKTMMGFLQEAKNEL